MNDVNYFAQVRAAEFRVDMILNDVVNCIILDTEKHQDRTRDICTEKSTRTKISCPIQQTILRDNRLLSGVARDTPRSRA